MNLMKFLFVILFVGCALNFPKKKCSEVEVKECKYLIVIEKFELENSVCEYTISYNEEKLFGRCKLWNRGDTLKND